MEEYYGQEQPPHDSEPPEIIQEFGMNDEREKHLNQIAPHRNYQGDWTELFYRRLSNPKTKERFIESKEHNQTTETRTSLHYRNPLGGISLDRAKDVPIDHYVESQTNYDNNREKIFNSTEYRHSSDFAKKPNNAGLSHGYGHPGIVFKDAFAGELKTKYTDRHKNIIEAHEKAHGIFDRLTNAEQKSILEPFNREKIGYGFSKQADEILARMSQLKNYFGFLGSEEFTLQHLAYARQNYIKDTGLDNNMSDFFGAITDDDKFVEIMNTFAC